MQYYLVKLIFDEYACTIVTYGEKDAVIDEFSKFKTMKLMDEISAESANMLYNLGFKIYHIPSKPIPESTESETPVENDPELNSVPPNLVPPSQRQ